MISCCIAGTVKPDPVEAPTVLLGASTKVLKGEDKFAYGEFVCGHELITFGLVADGHGGREAATHVTENVLERIAASAADGSSDALYNAAVQVFQALHDEVRNREGPAATTAGTTATVCAVNTARRELSLFNVGDSLGLLVHAGGYVDLGESHRLDHSKSEQERCQRMGARLGRALNEDGEPEGGLRAYPGGLAVTRGIGDADCGDVVCPTPAHTCVNLPDDGGAVVLASDGVWDNLPREDVTRILLDGRYDSAASAALSVVKQVLRTRGLNDDTTCVVLLFGKRPELTEERATTPDVLRRSSSGLLRRRSSNNNNSLANEPNGANSFLRRLSHDRLLMDISKDGCIIATEDDACSGTHRSGMPTGEKRYSIEAQAKAPADTAPTDTAPADTADAASSFGALEAAANVLKNVVTSDHSVKGGNFFALDMPTESVSNEAGNGNDPAARFGHSAHRRGSAKLEGLPQYATPKAGHLPTIHSRPATADVSSDSTLVQSPMPPGPLPLTAHNASEHESGDESFDSGPSTLTTPWARGRNGSPLHPHGRASRANAKRHSLATMFDSTVRPDNDSPGNVRRGNFLRKSGGAASKQASLPWHGSPMTRAVPAEGAGSHRRVRPEHTGTTDESGSGSDGDESGHARGWNLSMGVAEPNTRVVEYSQFTQLTYLGAGEFATVHADVLDGQPVALKILKQSKRDEVRAVKGLKREIMIMTLMEHPGVLRALALGSEHGKPFMVVEKLGRTLLSELPGPVDTTPVWVRWPQCKRWPLSRALDCAAQLAAALAYCHDDAFVGYRVLHRDVKPPNIGFKPDGKLVLFDFGLATLWSRDGASNADDEAPRKLTGETGSLRYMAPEVASSEPYNHKAEVFSFATVTWEMASHRRPFEGYSPEIFVSALKQGMRPQPSKRWSPELRDLLNSCWSAEIGTRPNMRDLVPILERLRDTERSLEAGRSKLQAWMRAIAS